jgi:hypothetical protein
MLADRIETTRAGQLRLTVPGLARGRYPTGQQTPCGRCAARQGVPRAGPSSSPLCLPCWRSDQDREARAAVRRQVAQGWEDIGEALACPMCKPVPAGDCWWCGDRSWLDGLRWVHERDQAAAAAADQARTDAEFARIAAVTAAERAVADLTGWRDRVASVLTRYGAGSGGRAVELLADFLARDAAARTSTRGRPPVARALVAAVLAADADWRSGRRAMPGRARAARLAGVSESAVSDGFRAAATSKWASRERIGGRNSAARRKVTGRWNDRAELDLCPLSQSPIAPAARAAHIQQALAILGRLLDRAQQLLDDALAELGALAADPPGWAEAARRAHSRQVARRAVAEVTAPAEPSRIDGNFATPHPVARGECVSTCPYRGLLFSPDAIHSRECPAWPARGRRNQSGASRSPTRGGWRPDHATCGTSPGRAQRRAQRRPPDSFPTSAGSGARRRRARPSWAVWAFDLARELIPAAPWLGPAKVPAVAAVLGARLGPDWTGPAVLALLPPWAEPDRPLAFLAVMLDRALTGDQAPAYPSRRYDAHRRAVAAAAHAAAQARLAGTLAELDAHAAGSTGAGLAAFRAARAQLWPAVTPPGGGLPEHWRHGTDRHDQADAGRVGPQGQVSRS